jgi:hypothetical protein
MKTKDLKLVLEKFLTSDAATNAVKSLASSISKLYEGKNIKELAACGLQLDACCLGLDACRLHLESL